MKRKQQQRITAAASNHESAPKAGTASSRDPEPKVGAASSRDRAKMALPRAALSQTTLVGERLAQAGIELPEASIAALTAFLGLLDQWGRVFNLTGIRSRGEMIDRHLLESLALRPLLEGQRIADVGSGAGLPGLPLAIAEPGRSFTLIESRAKRVRFLRHVVATLNIGNVIVAHCRAEDLPIGAPFDTVLARAVAPPAELMRLCRPLTGPGSRLVLLTAAHIGEAMSGAADDFIVVRQDPGLTVALRSAIVVLQRIET